MRRYFLVNLCPQRGFTDFKREFWFANRF